MTTQISFTSHSELMTKNQQYDSRQTRQDSYLMSKASIYEG